MPARTVRAAVAALALLAAAGCGGSKDGSTPMTDLEGVEQFIASVDDFKEVPQTFGKCFAAGAVPAAAELKKYQKYSFQLDGKPEMRDGEARVPIKVLAKDKEVGKVEWTVTKEGNSWKLKSAPLP